MSRQPTRGPRAQGQVKRPPGVPINDSQTIVPEAQWTSPQGLADLELRKSLYASEQV